MFLRRFRAHVSVVFPLDPLTLTHPVFSVSPMQPMENLPHSQHGVMYDLLPKPSDGIPIPRFPPHIAAFLSGNGDANQLNALVQALYQEIVKYEL